jgi:hypothetical protein
MPNYQNGKIYSIRSHLTDDVYIGSTIETLSNRLSQHKKYYKQWVNKISHYTTSYKIIEKDFDNCYIELVELYPCNSKIELHRREGEIIRATECVNKNIAGRTKKEWCEENKEKIAENKKQWCENNKEKFLEYQKQYRQTNKQQIIIKEKQFYDNNKTKILEQKKQYHLNNKEKITERKKQYYNNNKVKIKQKYTCECGKTLRKDGKKNHEKTTKHINFINSN